MGFWFTSILVLGVAFAAPVSADTSPMACAGSCVRDQLEHSAAAGDLVAKIELARALLGEKEQGANWRRAANLLQQAAATGDAWPVSILASLYIEGRGVPEDGRRVLALLIPLAAEDNVAAISGLGDLFARGAGSVAADPGRAAHYYERAAAKGDVHGKYQLALMLLEGRGVPEDVPRAVGLLEELSAGGDPWMLIQLGDVYASGKAGPAEKAIGYLSTAVETGNASAMVRLGQLYQSGIGAVAPDAGKAKVLYEKAAAQGDMAGRVLLAQMLLADDDAKSVARAVDLLEQARAGGGVWPTTVLANVYAQGLYVPRDGAHAVRLLQPFADDGNAAALVGLGNVYFAGAEPIAVDLREARDLFTRAAKAGDLSAKNRLGFMLLEGQGGAADVKGGLALLEPVMASGDTWAMLQLADLYAKGAALPLDAEQARGYYERAADLGNAAGLSRLGVLYRDGLGTITRDRDRALQYFESAVAEGDGSGRIYLALMLMEPGASQDVPRATGLLDAAAKTGDAWAATILADMLIKGDRVGADGVRAIALLKPLADKENPAALASLGNLYASGAGTVPADLGKAVGYFEAAAALGDYGAKSRLGLMLVKGEGIAADPARGLALLRDVAAIGDGWAKIQLGDVLASGVGVPLDAQGALLAYGQARDAGLPAANIKLGYLFLTGKGSVAADPAAAARYFAEAADAGDSVGKISLALLLLEGKGVEQDVGQAVSLLEEVASEGNAWANGTLGGVYADGRHVTPDYTKAWQFSAAAQGAGDAGAMQRLGMLLATGPLGGEHRAEGVKLVEAAVSADLPNALVDRARLKMMGLMGGDGGAAAEGDLLAEVERGNSSALRVLLQLYRSGGPGLKANLGRGQAMLGTHADMLSPEALAFETIALRAVPPATERSLAAVGAALPGIASADFSQTVQMLFWGNKNAYVYVVQRQLRELGLYGGPVDGYLGRPTIAAINRLCAAEGAEAMCAPGPLTPGVAVFLGNYLANPRASGAV